MVEFGRVRFERASCDLGLLAFGIKLMSTRQSGARLQQDQQTINNCNREHVGQGMPSPESCQAASSLRKNIRMFKRP